MANLSNADLSLYCTSTGYPGYVKATEVASTPSGDPGIGNQGDYFYVDPSFYFKVSSTVWVQIDVSAVADGEA